MRELIVTETSWEHNPHLNVAMEEAIHRSVDDTAILRFWRNANAVVIGRHQCPLAEINQAICSRLGTKIIRRHTGGGAVYHDTGNLNISLAFPKRGNTLDDFQSIRARFVTAIISTLKTIAVGSYTSTESSISTASGHKLCGIAGSINSFAYFIHASLLVSSDLAKLTNILASDYKTPPGLVASHRSEVVNVKTLAMRSQSMESMKQLVVRQITAAFGLAKSGSSLCECVVEEAHELADIRYRKTGWLFEPCIARDAECLRRTVDGQLHDLLFENANALFVCS